MPAETQEAAANARPKLHISTREKVMFGVVAALLVGGAAAARYLTGYQKVWLLNGLDVPVDVEIDGRTTRVDALGTGDQRLASGVHEVRVKSEAGATLEERTIDVRSMNDAVVYNVLGAGLLYVQKVTYSSYKFGHENEDENAVTIYAGEPFVTRDNIHYVFKEPPQSIEVKSASGSIIKWHMGVAPGGLSNALAYLESQGKSAEVMRIARAVVDAKPGAGDALGYLLYMTDVTEGSGASLSLARSFRDRAPLAREAHWYYQAMMARTGQFEALRAEYRERYAKQPDSALEGVLLSRVEDEESGAGDAVMDGLLKRFPSDPSVLDWAGRRAFLREKYAESVEYFDKLKGTPRENDSADRHALALVALGRLDEALAFYQRAFAAVSSGVRDRVLYAKLLRLAGQDIEPALRPGPANPAEPETRASESLRRAWVLSSLGADVPGMAFADVEGDRMRSVISIQTAAADSPAAAWSACVGAAPGALRQLDLPIAVLIAAELARAGDLRMAERILGQRIDLAVPPSVIFDFVASGAMHPELKFTDPEVRAALAFVRSRRLAELGQKNAEMLALAERLDIGKGIVARAREKWPPIQKEAPAPPVDVLTLTRQKAGG